MKLSEIEGERVLDVIADLIEPMGRIAENEAFRELTKPKKLAEGEDATEAFFGRVREQLPSIIRENKADVISILATLNGASAEEYEKGLTVGALLKDVIDIMTDEETFAFLASSVMKTDDSSAGGE